MRPLMDAYNIKYKSARASSHEYQADMASMLFRGVVVVPESVHPFFNLVFGTFSY
jgi:hypothetical protein